jgi:hypothetical protein
VIVDGCPSNKKTASQLIVDATQSMASDQDLCISFVQVGDDERCSVWLKELNVNIKGKGRFDVVDVVSASSLKDMDFPALVKKSLE